MSAIRISLCAKKGGVGKTSLSVNVAGYLASEHKCRVLLIDTDSQSSLSQFFMKPQDVDMLRREETIAAAFDPNCDIDPEKMIHATNIEGLYLVPASDHLADFNLPRPEEQPDAMQTAIRSFLREVEKDFTFVIIDTAPQLQTLTTWASLVASDFVLSPIEPELFSAQSIAGTDRILSAAQERNRGLSFLGYIVNRKQKQRRMHASFEDRLRAIHGDRVLDQTVTNLTAFAEAQAKRVPITSYDASSDAALMMKNLSREIVGRIERHINRKNSQQQLDGKAA
jgi:chromosome partitioning protein